MFYQQQMWAHMDAKLDSADFKLAQPPHWRARLASLPWRTTLLAGFGGAATIGCLGALGDLAHLPLLIAPFGASSALVYGLPSSPLAQPRNVVGGHILAAASGLLMLSLLGPGVPAAACGVGLAIAVMMLTGTMHPPAGANPIVAGIAGVQPLFLAFPVLVGSITIVLLAIAYHRLVTGHAYPAAR